MTFNFYETEVGKTYNKPKKDYAKEAEELLMVKHNNPKNTERWEQFDCSQFNKDDVVLLIDADWITFSSASNEMKRYVEFTHNGITHEFTGYKPMKKWCIENDVEYNPELGIKKQSNHQNAVIFAKSSIKKKVASGIYKTGANKVVMFCGSTGNHRDKLPLPKLCDGKIYNYKGDRPIEWIPETLPEIKDWTMGNWLSHWAVFEETDDCLTIAKHTLDKLGIKCYIMGVDKDFRGENIGGTYIIGHQENPEYFVDTEENRLGWIKASKTTGGSGKMLGRGDMFLAYQIIDGDSADGYSAKDMMKKFGTLKQFGYKGVEKYLTQFKTRKELWQGVVDHFKKYLPEEFEYEDCFGVKHKATPMTMLNLYYKCAKMREYQEHIPDVIEDRLKPLGVEY